MPDYVVNLSVVNSDNDPRGKKGTFTINPTTLVVDDEDTVTWSAGGSKFVIHFNESSPIVGRSTDKDLQDQITIYSGEENRAGPFSVRGAPRGVYEYSVALLAGDLFIHVSGEVTKRRP